MKKFTLLLEVECTEHEISKLNHVDGLDMLLENLFQTALNTVNLRVKSIEVSNKINEQKLLIQRSEKAEDFFIHNDLLGYQVKDASEWEIKNNRFRRTIYVESDVWRIRPNRIDSNVSLKKVLSIYFKPNSYEIQWANIDGDTL